MTDMAGKHVFITGASRGIGRATAHAFANQGAQLTLTATKQENLQETAASINNPNLIDCDLSGLEATKDLAGQIATMAPDIFVCNAAITRDNLSIRMSDEDWDLVLRVNLRAAAILTTAACKAMMKKKWGRVILLSSIVGLTGNAGQANYTASKAGLIGFGKTMALEFAARNVTVNCIAPGFIDTDMTSGLKEDYKQALISQIPMKRMGTPEDIANTALFLASEAAGYITGQTISVNGGMLMP